MSRVVLVTGASRGIGKAIAENFAKNGATVILNYFSNGSIADEVCKELNSSYNTNCIAVQADVSKQDEVQRMFACIRDKFGKLDVLVNCAGITRDQLACFMSSDEWNSVLETNLSGAFYCCKEALMLLSSGEFPSIINISSVNGLIGSVGQINYSASKAGLIAITKTLAKEVARLGITVNVVAPGLIDSGMAEGITDKRKEELLSNIPLGRLGKTDEVAELVQFLSGEKARYITGQTFIIDGGLSC